MARAPLRTPGKAATAEEITTTTKTEVTSTSTASTPVQQVNQSEQDLEPQVDQPKTSPAEHSDRIDQILQNQIRIESKLDQLLKAGGIEAAKKQRWVEGKHGLELREVK